MGLMKGIGNVRLLTRRKPDGQNNTARLSRRSTPKQLKVLVVAALTVLFPEI